MTGVLWVFDGADLELAAHLGFFGLLVCAANVNAGGGVSTVASIFQAFTDLERENLLGNAARRRRVLLYYFGHVFGVELKICQRPWLSPAGGESA